MTAHRTDGYAPIQAVSGRLTAPVHGDVFDFVRVGFVRRGAVMVHGAFGSQRVQRGELVSLAPHIAADPVPGPEGVEYTTVYIDRDLLHELAAWESPALLRGRSEAGTVLRERYPHGFAWRRIGEQTLREVEPLLDELVELTRRGQLQSRFKRALAILFDVLDRIDPTLSGDPSLPPPIPARADGATERGQVRRRRPQPLRSEVARVIELIESDLARSWRMEELAAIVGLSAGHLRQLFTDGLGATPAAYQNLLRVQRAEVLLADRSRSVPEVMAEVGWSSPSHWTTMFRRHTGMTPRQYRDQT